MIVAGIVGHQGKIQTANLINSILSLTGKKVSVINSKSLAGLGSRLMKNYICELEKNNTDILVIKIDISDVADYTFNDLHFDVIIYTDQSDELSESEKQNHERIMRCIFKMIDEKGVAIINIDEGDALRLLEGARNHIVTYGFNSKASITTSSVGDSVFDDSFICCLQKTISAKDGQVIEPQEYRLNFCQDDIDRHSLLAAATFAIVNGIDLNALNGVSQGVSQGNMS